MEPFGELLYQAIEAKGLSVRDFAATVGSSHRTLSAIHKGIRKPNLRHLDQWATALGLKGAARRQFLIAGNLTHTPPLIAAEYLRLIETERSD